MRVTAYIDGFNLYHAIDATQNHHLKWLDLYSLARIFAPPPTHVLTDVFYFSAFATWRKGAYYRHRAYVEAMRATGVTPIMGNFKGRKVTCKRCNAQWTRAEEKETDINIGIHLVQGAYEDHYDIALLVTSDTDLTPAVKMIYATFQSKIVKIITPQNHDRVFSLVNAAGDPSRHSRIKPTHIRRNLLPRHVYDAEGNLVATRPTRYDPP